jgi:RNA polymerase sigma-70 factor, ECF subfamily
MIKKFQDLVFNFVYYKVNDYHVANDITSQVMALYCLKCHYQDNNKIKGWLINSAKNFLKKFYTQNTRDRHKFIQYSEELPYFASEDLNEEDHNSLSTAFQEAFEKLSKKELEIILLYLRCGKSIKKMHPIVNGSYEALKKRVSRIRKKLKAETYKNLGFYGSKRIVTPELDNQIYQFLRRFKKNLEAGTLEKMHYYFSEVDINEYKQTFKIRKIFNYDINLNDSVYKTWVFFKNENDDIDTFFVDFYVDKNNHLKILSPPTRVNGIIIIEPESSEGKQIKSLLNSYPIDKLGRPKIPNEELNKIIKQHKDKQKIISKKSD